VGNPERRQVPVAAGQRPAPELAAQLERVFQSQDHTAQARHSCSILPFEMRSHLIVSLRDVAGNGIGCDRFIIIEAGMKAKEM